jgi:hypothetical protein
MYVVRVEHSKELRSWHQETASGLNMAVEEAEMRTHASGVPHVVTDNHGLRLHLALPAEVKKRLEEAREQNSAKYDWWLSAFAAAVWLVSMFYWR